MVTCPRCAQQADETTRSTCPNCFAPLTGPGMQPGGPTAAAPVPPGQPYPPTPGPLPAPQQPYPPQPSRNPGARVSLTGEVIEQNGPAAPPPSYVAGGAPSRPPVGGPPRTGGTASSRTAYAPQPSTAPTKSGGGIIAILVGLLVLGGLGAGGWWFLRPHTSPKVVVQQFDTALGARDWKTIYMLVEFPADTKTKYPNADAFASSMNSELEKAQSIPGAGSLVDSFTKAYQSAQVGEPTINGDTATVPVTMTVSLSFGGAKTEKTSTQQIPLRKVSGVWKIDGMQGAMSGAGALGGM